MKTATVVINAKETVVHEFYFDDFPGVMEHLTAISGPLQGRPAAFRAIMARCSDVTEDDLKKATLQEVLGAVPKILELNDLKVSPKAQAEGAAPSADTTSEQPRESPEPSTV
jgi:hypothetical protein